MMRRVGVMGCLLLALGGLPLLAQAPGCAAPVSVSGLVTTRGGDPIPDAGVIVPAAQLRLVTDAQGVFTIRDVCPGPHRVRVTHLGYATVDREFELTAGSVLSIRMSSQAVELEGVMVSVAPVMVRLERRHATYGGRSAAFDWRDFTDRPVPTNIPEWVVTRAGARVVRCGDAYWGTRDCIADREGLRRVEVCVDETESVSTPTAVSHFPREEIGRAEFYRREGLLKIYTKDFLARAALGSWMIRSDPTAC